MKIWGSARNKDIMSTIFDARVIEEYDIVHIIENVLRHGNSIFR